MKAPPMLVLVDVMRHGQPRTQKELSEATGLCKNSVQRIVRVMRQMGLIDFHSYCPEGTGRVLPTRWVWAKT